ncbi:MAG: triose-phosphate isomerase [archaeon]
MRTPIMAANWKMYKNESEALDFVKKFKPLVSDAKNVEIIINAPYTLLSTLKHSLLNSNISLGAENMHFEDKGAFTGEISATMLKDYVKYVIIGHSERRQYFNESNEIINKKIKKALEHGLKVIFCLGETLEQREKGVTNEVVSIQLKEGLAGIHDMANIVVAYEPVWAIGTGKTATPEQAQEVHAFLRQQLSNLFGSDVAEEVRILYGGSVKPDNVAKLMSQNDIDGGLVGGAALEPESFAKLVKF